MIKAIIYDNREDRGYGFYERSADFPDEIKSAILDRCNKLTDCPTTLEPNDTWGIHYSPLDSTLFLLSVIFRCNSSAGLNRVHNQAINFVMDQESAAMLLSFPFLNLAPFLYKQSRILLEEPGRVETEDFSDLLLTGVSQEPTSRSASSVPAEVRLAAIKIAEQRPMRAQAWLIGVNPLLELDYILSEIPLDMLPMISFQTGVLSVLECEYTAINFPVTQIQYIPIGKNFLSTMSLYFWKRTPFPRGETDLPKNLIAECSAYAKNLALIKSPELRLQIQRSAPSISKCLEASSRCKPDCVGPLIDLLEWGTFKPMYEAGILPKDMLDNPLYHGSNLIKNLKNERRRSAASHPRAAAHTENPKDNAEPVSEWNQNARSSSFPSTSKKGFSDYVHRFCSVWLRWAAMAAAGLLLLGLFIYLCLRGFNFVPLDKEIIVVCFTPSAVNELLTRIALCLLSIGSTTLIAFWISKHRHS